ncbi:MAG: 2-dehydropantoate 2-reductase [Lachnospiraceae bacterium]|nr:2-dehydropantoate 2-reductase [Lachnospiraceae bacterium]
MKKIQTTAIIGMGALGMLYADQILTAQPSASVDFVAEPDRICRYQEMTSTVNGTPRMFLLKDSHNAEPADLVIVAVKYTALSAALDTMTHCIGPNTTIISVLNGITSEQIIGERYGAEKVLGCIAQGMDAVKFGGDLTFSKPGELRIGTFSDDQADRLQSLTEYLTRTGIAYTVEPDIRYRLWGKFMLNVGVNQTCMAYETNYGGSLTPGETYDTMIGAMREVIQLANLEGIPLTEHDLTTYIDLIRTLSPTGMPSMRQDGISHRKSEVALFSGTVRTLAARHHLPVPINDRLYERILELERQY